MYSHTDKQELELLICYFSSVLFCANLIYIKQYKDHLELAVIDRKSRVAQGVMSL